MTGSITTTGRAALMGALLLLVAGGGGAEDFPVGSTGRPRFVADVSVIPSSISDSVTVEILWEVPYAELMFRKESRRYRAVYDFRAVLTSGGRQVAGEVWERRVRALSLEETRSNSLYSTGRKKVPVPPGRYEIRLSVADRLASTTSEAEGDLDARLDPDRIGLSDLRFLRYTEEGFVSNPGRQIPVGDDGHFVRVTLRPRADLVGTFLIRWRIDATTGGRVAESDTTVVLAGEKHSLEIPLPAEKLHVGEHTLTVEVEGDGTGKVERRKTTLQAKLTPRWFEAHREEALEVLETIVGSEDEIRPLETASDEEWPDRLDGFWKRRDPDPGTEENEFRTAVQLRMETSATLFQEPFRKPGWRTDRGKILLRHGPPDRRTVRPGDIDAPASEVWEYDAPRRVFHFIDEMGSGEFWLRG